MSRLTSLSRFLLALLLCFLPPYVFGSEVNNDPRRHSATAFRVDVEVVNVVVTVQEKRNGKFIDDLQAGDFRVEEDGVRQEVKHFARQTELPLMIGLCMDTSGSVKPKLDLGKQAAIDFIRSVMRSKDQALLVKFDTRATLLSDFISDPNVLARQIQSLFAQGGTSIYDTICYIAKYKMTRNRGRNVLVLLSDGVDLRSKQTFEEALRMAYQMGITIYAISTGERPSTVTLGPLAAKLSGNGDRVLKEFARGTGGKAFFPRSPRHLVSAFQKINRELRNQYSLGYVSNNKSRRGEFRKIKVKVRRRGAHIRHRKGYFAPSPL